MKKDRKPYGYWTKEICKLEAKKYKTKTEFIIGNNSAYIKASKNGWIDEICNHMKPIGHLFKRCVYVYIFVNNYAYVGLTCNLKKRHRNRLQQKKQDTVVKLIKKGIKYKLEQLTDYINVETAQKLEYYYIEEYRAKYTILNKAKAGALGGNAIKWHKKACKKEALKYDTRSEFIKNAHSAYAIACERGWINEICEHMILNRKPRLYWDKKSCKKEALKYKTKTEFSKESSRAYCVAWENDWLDDICKHMTSTQKPKGYWTYENCKKEALKYSSRCEFEKGTGAAYVTARRNDWLNEICEHMIQTRNPKGYWTFETCRKEALKYDRRVDFKKKSSRAYSLSCEKGWLNEICEHMMSYKKSKTIK